MKLFVQGLSLWYVFKWQISKNIVWVRQYIRPAIGKRQTEKGWNHSMTGKQIFWNKSIETDISEIIQEILHYVDSQRDNGTLNPNYYDSIL